VTGISGRLVTASFAQKALTTLAGAERVPPTVARALESWQARVEAALGPASSIRSVTDVAVIPLLALLGYQVASRHDEPHGCTLQLAGASPSSVVALIAAWGAPLQAMWRESTRHAAATDARWILCCNGTSLRVVDGQRTWSRDYLEFDLAQVAHDDAAMTMLWSLVRARAMAESPPVLEAAVARSARHGVDVCRTLGNGVLESLQLLVTALRRPGSSPAPLFEQSLTVLYRVLFLLFAEARGLVPLWHPVYRDRYSIESIVSALLAKGLYRGVWHAVQAISRLAHSGFSTSGLRVTAFNGRLFAPGHAADFDRRPIPDAVMTQVVLAVATTPVTRGGARARIAYGDLDVEQLGAVYEQVLEYQPPDVGRNMPASLRRTRELRKATGTFYTPRALTAALVRQTLAPLVEGATFEQIVSLRVLDPAMGSGAFLVGACRYLAAAAEDALVREGRWHPHDVTIADRIELRRTIAVRCLYGVDVNPMAVQLARLSLWLVTLAADKPLSFLDHHLIAGDSLVGASTADLGRQPSRVAGRRARHVTVPLFEGADAAPVLDEASRIRRAMGTTPDDDVSVVRSKERALAALDARDSALGRWRRALDLWCAGWFTPDGDAIDRRTFLALTDHLLTGRSILPAATAERLLAAAAAVAERYRFVHWELAFPEIFVDEQGARRPEGGFDAVIGNPPWDMVRGDAGDAPARGAARNHARQLQAFVREAGIYRVEGRAHMNRYQLFTERAFHLTRRHGRIGLVLPSGVISDVGAAPLRRFLFDRAAVDTVTGIDNRDAIFPIHRSVRFVLLSATAGAGTETIRCRFGVRRASDLDRDTQGLTLTRRFLTHLSGADDLGMPELASPRDLAIVERLAATCPALASAQGWQVTFGRELNATDDRGAFRRIGHRRKGRPVLEGKHIDSFRAHLDRCRVEVPPASPAAARAPQRERLAYRDVASAGNRLTIIAALVPAHAITTHTLCCLKTPLASARQRVLCALLNSFVANYLVRMRVTTHLTVGLMSRLPVPFISPGSAEGTALAHLTRALERGQAAIDEMPEYAQLQARVARLYGLTREEFKHVLDTFPLIPASTRAAALTQFNEVKHL
jgi:hypothetical protein